MKEYTKEGIENWIQAANGEWPKFCAPIAIIRQLLADLDAKEKETATVSINAATIAANQAVYLRELLDIIKRVESHKINTWLSAALSDPSVCSEMRSDIGSWFDLIEEMQK